MILSIIIPCWNRVDLTTKVVDQLKHLPNDHEVIVVNNGSTDDTRDAVLFSFCQIANEGTPHFILHNLPKNEGYSRACNEGWIRSKGSNVLFMNNDVEIKNCPTWTKPIIELCGTEALIGASACWLSPRKLIPKGPTTDVYKTNTYLEGWFIAASRQTFQKLTPNNQPGPWDERFFLYFEDTDLSMRAHHLRIPLILAQPPIIHLCHNSTDLLLEAKSHYRKSQKIFQGMYRKQDLPPLNPKRE